MSEMGSGEVAKSFAMGLAMGFAMGFAMRIGSAGGASKETGCRPQERQIRAKATKNFLDIGLNPFAMSGFTLGSHFGSDNSSSHEKTRGFAISCGSRMAWRIRNGFAMDSQ